MRESSDNQFSRPCIEGDKCSKDLGDLYAKKHALLALTYWKNCTEECDLPFQIEHSSLHDRLGKSEN